MEKRMNGNFYKTDGVTLILTALLTAIASEIKVVPFNGDAFRFGLGSITFFLLILVRPPASLILTGFVTGVTVVSIRLIEDLLLFGGQLFESFSNHSPAFLFYFVFALGLKCIQVEKVKTYPLLLGAWAALFEFIGNGSEYLFRSLISHSENVGFRDWALVSGVAILRSYFVVGLYSTITVSEQKRQMQELLGIGSELYAETLYLQKSMNHIEQITASSHELYRKLKKENLRELSTQALLIAQEIHEVKKDSQRIYSGLSKLTNPKRNDIFYLSDVLELVISANKKYSELLQKNIHFQLSLSQQFETDQQIPLLALLNNITANAVEAIPKKGSISFNVFEKSDMLYFEVEDTGEGIPEDDRALIFEPGYTTKFNHAGVAATGIGLSHVQEIVSQLEGQVAIEALPTGTLFIIQIPTNNIRK
ncbi:sensor histidine kinase [Sporosarcina sp. ACRSM]|uniref:sensor histidine kinase n=1 Tax=Sporosarcina sp. ACRSM TaxID=2918216 RepID=UPI001EF71BAA|nr:sensor histidine kinase [Sporosarcina sp. ACRSM]MCG7335174.1 sensor histidine kinase [Sporosarcina sp. ACRSM]